MPQSLARAVRHVVSGRKHRVPSPQDREVRERMLAYRAGALQSLGCEPILINGTEYHVRIKIDESYEFTGLALLVAPNKRTQQ